jgi:mono/diheme cytochrome c family protein
LEKTAKEEKMKKVLLAILFLLTSLGYQQLVDQKIALASIPKENLNLFEVTQSYQPGLKKVIELQEGMALFVEKCSECHELDRALTVYKDPKILEQTIKKMQSYSKGAITDQQTKELVGFHVSEQQREIIAFKETCTHCHGDKRINNRTLSADQWLETIKRMQQKASELISDEKINLLAAYFHRRELTMAKIFSGQCHVCHYVSGGKATSMNLSGELGGVVVLASEELGERFQRKDLDSLVSYHIRKELEQMDLYRNNCKTCHPDGQPKREKLGQVKKGGRSRDEWISLIASLQGQDLNKETRNKIKSQIDYHVSRYLKSGDKILGYK